MPLEVQGVKVSYLRHATSMDLFFLPTFNPHGVRLKQLKIDKLQTVVNLLSRPIEET